MISFFFLSFLGTRAYEYFLTSQSHPMGQETDEKALKEWVASVEKAYSKKKPIHTPSTASPRKHYAKRTHIPYSGGNKKPKSRPTESVGEDKKPIEIVIEDINEATPEALRRVKGIGETYSKRIVKYKERLGGYHTLDQLSEVYGLSEETLNELKTYFQVRSSPARLPVNTDSAKTLAQHPYISYDLAWVILNYRKQHGKIVSKEDLFKIKAMDSLTVHRIAPYLDYHIDEKNP